MAVVEEESEGSQEVGLTAGEDGQARDVWRGGERDGGEDGDGADWIREGSEGIGRGADICGESRGVCIEERETVEGVGGKHREKKEEVEVEGTG